MNSITMLQDIQKHIPIVGDINIKSPLAYQATRGAVEVVNTVQMAVAEAYINGLYQLGLTMRQLVKAPCQVSYQGCPDAQSCEN